MQLTVWSQLRHLETKQKQLDYRFFIFRLRRFLSLSPIFSGNVTDSKPSTALLVEHADWVIVGTNAQIPKNHDLDPEEFRPKFLGI